MRHRDVLDVIEAMSYDELRAAQTAHLIKARELAKEMQERQRWAILMAREAKRRRENAKES